VAGASSELFTVQGVSRVLLEPDEVAWHERAYDALLQRDDCPGMYWNLYLKGIEEPDATIHSQIWASQRHSEEFGVSPGFQALRSELSTAAGPRAHMVGPLSPGYWRPVLETVVRTEPTGCADDGDELGVVLHGMSFVRPGSEHAYLEAERALAAALGLQAGEGVYATRCFQSLGQPNAFSWVRHARDGAALDGALDAVAEAERARGDLVVEETVGRYRVWLLATWPQRRLVV
jgi:hypothetical protein